MPALLRLAFWRRPLSPYLRAVLPDDLAERIEAGFATADRATLSRWVRSLLDDRRAPHRRVPCADPGLSHARQRFKQAFEYLDALMRKAVG